MKKPQLKVIETGRNKARFKDSLGAAQGAYYLATGLWPLIDINSFQMVTGPKRDIWLVRTVGVLVSAIGLSMLLGSKRRASKEQATLAIGSALGLAAIDTAYSMKGTISKVYLLDAAAELAFAGLWSRRLARRRRGDGQSGSATFRPAHKRKKG